MSKKIESYEREYNKMIEKYSFRNFIIYTLRKIFGDRADHGWWGGHAALMG
jgi:hypothetical protein